MQNVKGDSNIINFNELCFFYTDLHVLEIILTIICVFLTQNDLNSHMTFTNYRLTPTLNVKRYVCEYLLSLCVCF